MVFFNVIFLNQKRFDVFFNILKEYTMDSIESLNNQEDVNPGTELDKIINDDEPETNVKTSGTGANNPVPTPGTVVIKENDHGDGRIVENRPSKPSN